MSTQLLTGVHDRVAVLTMNRPEKRNALSRQLIGELTTAFEWASTDAGVRSIVLTGSGSAFCAGMDLEELAATRANSDVWTDAQRLSDLYQRIYTCPKPTVAAVNGAAVAGGAGLMTVCDLAIAVPGAKIGYPEVRRGLVAAMVLPHLLRHVGERTARWLLLTGELIDSVDGIKLGLLNSVAAEGQLLDVARQWCGRLHLGGPKALATTKELLRTCSGQAVSVEALARASAEPRLTDECRQGLAAFFDNRPVPWADES